jgi:hypothetical protein
MSIAATADRSTVARLNAAIPRAPGAAKRLRERAIEMTLFLCGARVGRHHRGDRAVLLYESALFFSHVSIFEFLTGTVWTPLFCRPQIRHPAAGDRHAGVVGSRVAGGVPARHGDRDLSQRVRPRARARR